MKQEGGKKYCPSCKELKPVGEYYKTTRNIDGLALYCTPCDKARKLRHIASNPNYYESARAKNRIYKTTNAEKVSAERKRYRSTERGRMTKKKAILAHEKRYPERKLARQALQRAVSKGNIKRMPCEVCGEVGSHGHHDDYSKQLEVRWLCQKHHSEFHNLNRNTKS